MGIIVTIGGGSIETGGTLAIDSEIKKLSGKRKPRLLFIPTASSDSEVYTQRVCGVYKTLGCTTSVLNLIRDKPSSKEINSKIGHSDIIYVGGGNTLKMMRLWRKLGVDTLLKKAWIRGVVLCGLSAGSICWYESGHSDSMCFYNPKKWQYINVKGLGFIKGIHCPHYNSETLGRKRKNYFKAMIKKIGGVGIAIENNCAIVYFGDKFKVIRSRKGSNAYKIYRKRGEIIYEKIPDGGKIRELV
jgi:dipeptidase E